MATPIPPNAAPFSLDELSAAAGGRLVRRGSATSVVGIATDSRAIAPGQAFVAIRGEKLDGHLFAEGAVARGATAVVVERGRPAPDGDICVIEVEDALVAFGLIARAHVRRWRAAGAGRRVVAVTGSAGKTTTKELIASLLGAVGSCLATAGNLNNRVGLPAVALGLVDHAYAVFELGMNVSGEIEKLASIVEPDVALLLNVGAAHAEGFGGSLEAIAEEKGAIFAHLAAHGVAVVAMDDERVRAQAARTSARRVGFGVAPTSDVRLVSREWVGRGARVTLARSGRPLEVTLPVAGAAVALDLAAAIAAADAAVGHELSGPVIAGAIARWKPPSGRAVAVDLEDDVWALDDTYNANPASMRAALGTLLEIKARGRARAIAVLGEMRELGPLSDAEHEALGDLVARGGVELVIGCGGAMDRALRRAKEGGVEVHQAADADEAGALVASLARSGDVVLFKGSRAAEVERALAALVARHPRVANGDRDEP